LGVCENVSIRARVENPCYDSLMNRWLARLSLSFFIVAALLVWEIYNVLTGRRGQVSEARLALYMVACIFAVVLGAMGVRARHRGP
jgi:cytochrome c oxidase assembly factor CtaG